MRRSHSCSARLAVLIATAAALLATAAAASASIGAHQAITRFLDQGNPLAKPHLGKGWFGFAARYALRPRHVAVVRGRHIGAGGCTFDSKLSLPFHSARIELRERAIRPRTCQALVETGVPPLRPPAAPARRGFESRAATHTWAFPQLSFAPVPDPLAGGPGGEVDPNQPVPPDYVDPADAEPGNTDAVPQPGEGAEADPGPPNGDACQTAPCSPPTVRTTVEVPCPNGRATNGDCCADHDCRSTYPSNPVVFVARRLPPGWYTSAGEWHSWWEDPVQIDVASDRDRVSYPFGNGCVHNPFSTSWQLDWYTTSGWYLKSDNHRSGAVCGYGYQSTYAEMKNDVFCRALIGPLFGRTSRAYFDRNTIRGLGNGTLKAVVHSSVKGGCVRLLHFNHKLTRTA
jgi:hypothetical protein